VLIPAQYGIALLMHTCGRSSGRLQLRQQNEFQVQLETPARQFKQSFELSSKTVGTRMAAPISK